MQIKHREDETIRILVVDDTRIHSQLMADVLKNDVRLEVFDSGSQAVAETAGSRKANVLIISARIDEKPLGGLDVLRKVRSLLPEVRGIVLLDSSKRDVILSSFRAGAQGLFNRDMPLESLSECVRQVHSGKVWATAEQMTIALEALEASPAVRAVDSNGLNLLSKREMEVVSSLAEGLSNREIAARLGLSQHTVKNYLFRVFDKLGVSSRIELLFLTLNHSLPHPTQQGRSNQKHGSSFSAVRQEAMEGMPHAQMTLAAMYAEGKSVEQDLASAYTWYLMCEKNILEMKDTINAKKRKIAELLSTEEILEAQKLASERHKKPAQSQRASDSTSATAIL